MLACMIVCIRQQFNFIIMQKKNNLKKKPKGKTEREREKEMLVG